MLIIVIKKDKDLIDDDDAYGKYIRGERMRRRRTNVCDSALFFVRIGNPTWYVFVLVKNFQSLWFFQASHNNLFPISVGFINAQDSVFFQVRPIHIIFKDIQRKRLIIWTMKNNSAT